MDIAKSSYKVFFAYLWNMEANTFFSLLLGLLTYSMRLIKVTRYTVKDIILSLSRRILWRNENDFRSYIVLTDRRESIKKPPHATVPLTVVLLRSLDSC